METRKIIAAGAILGCCLWMMFGCSVAGRLQRQQTTASLSQLTRAERQERQQDYRPQVVKLQRDSNTFYLTPVDTLADGERVMALQIEQVTVVAKMRSIPERNGRVVLDFIVTLPKQLLGRSRSVVITPILHKPDESVPLEDLVIRGGRFSLLQERDYWQYETYVERFRPDTVGREAAFNRFVKFPYPEDARLDSLVEGRSTVTYYYSQAVKTDETSKKMLVTLQGQVLAVDVMESSDAIPMTDRGTLAVDGAGRCTPSSLRVTRSAAKIAYTIEVADAVAPSLRLRSVQFCNLPQTIRPFDSGSISSTVEANYYDGEAMPVNNEWRTAGTAYLFENLQGSVDTITDQKDKCPENAPSCATYLRILAERSADKALVEYIVYPGENNTSDFNVRRNTWHNLELVIMGENEIDNRVLVYDGLYYGTANCHICTGDQVTFDVTPYRTSRSRNYAYLGIEAGDEYAPASAGLLWQDNKIITGFTLADNRLTVHTNGQRGNALVAVYDAGGTILWSWHIWCLPGDHPQDDRYTNRAGEQFLVMDRNLGAIGTDLKTRYGLVYTWGRKDPFTSNEVYNAAGRKDRFINYWPTIYTSNGSEAKTYDLTYMTRHPTTYVYTGWYAKLYTYYNNALWGDPAPVDTYGWASAKSVHDPCPEGYRLPSRYTWTAFENYVFPGEPYVVGAFDNGYWFQRFRGDTKGTFYPVPVGNDDFWLDRDGVAVMLTGAASEPTSATPYPTVYFKFEINSGWTNFEGGKGKGLVRCVRE